MRVESQDDTSVYVSAGPYFSEGPGLGPIGIVLILLVVIAALLGGCASEDCHDTDWDPDAELESGFIPLYSCCPSNGVGECWDNELLCINHHPVCPRGLVPSGDLDWCTEETD